MTERVRSRIAFVFPSVGRKVGSGYIRSWQMEPLAIAQLSALTPPSFDRVFYDDRIEMVPYDAPVDLVAISVETYTARRAYQIATRYRARGVPVVMGGYHPTLVPDEALRHADAIVIGEAERAWPRLLRDFSEGHLERRYQEPLPSLDGVFPDRTIYHGKRYLDFALVETARGCRFGCEFCSISSFFRQTYSPRPVEEVVEEVRSLGHREVFFVDDNLTADPERTQRLLEGLLPLRIRWAGQAGMNVTQDKPLLRLMKRSGCAGLLIGFESLDPQALATMGKVVNLQDVEHRERGLDRLRECGLAVYATFVFGYDGDTEGTFRKTLAFALRHGFFFTAFNHLVPFPGTPLYKRLQAEGRLISNAWWLSSTYRFGDLAFHPRSMSAQRLADLCFEYRRRFYSCSSIFRRAAVNWRANCPTLGGILFYLGLNFGSRLDTRRRQGLPLGIPWEPVAIPPEEMP